MKKMNQLALASLLLVTQAGFAIEYSGTVNDLNSIFDPPSNIQGIICQQTVNDGNANSFKACSDGVASARWMAEKYAKNSGKYLGCMDGFYQGMGKRASQYFTM